MYTFSCLPISVGLWQLYDKSGSGNQKNSSSVTRKRQKERHMDNAQGDRTQARLAQLEEEVAALRARERRQPLRAVSPLIGAALVAALALLLVSAVSAAPLPN